MSSGSNSTKSNMQTITMRDALRQALEEEFDRDARVFIMGEEVADYNGAYKVTKGMLERYGPQRVMDTPISELGFAGAGIGAAMTGMRPIVEFMSFNFSFVACDQIISNAAKNYYMSGGRFNVPIVFRGPNGAAAQVSCQHSHCVESFYSHFPGLKVIAPSDPYDAKGLLKSAIRDNNPVIFLECEMLYGMQQEIPLDPYLLPIGKAKVKAEGKDLSIITHGRMVHEALQASSVLKQKNISAEVIDLRTIKPLDMATIAQSVRKTGRALLVEEGHGFAGITSEVSAQIGEQLFDFLDAPVTRLFQKETPMPYSKPLEEATLPSSEKIVKKALSMWGS